MGRDIDEAELRRQPQRSARPTRRPVVGARGPRASELHLAREVDLPPYHYGLVFER